MLLVIFILLLLIFFMNFIFKWAEYKKIEKIINRYNLEIDKNLKHGGKDGRDI